MRDVNEFLAELDNAAEFGFGIECRGAEEAREAADRIRYLSAELHNAGCVVDRLQRDKIVLREALVKIVGAAIPAELEIMKTHVQAMLILIGPNKDAEAAIAGINALLDTQ